MFLDLSYRSAASSGHVIAGYDVACWLMLSFGWFVSCHIECLKNKRNNSCSGHLQYTWNVGLSDNASDVPSLSWQYYAGHLHAFYSTVAQGRPETRHLALITALLDRISTADKKKRLWILPRLKITLILKTSTRQTRNSTHRLRHGRRGNQILFLDLTITEKNSTIGPHHGRLGIQHLNLIKKYKKFDTRTHHNWYKKNRHANFTKVNRKLDTSTSPVHVLIINLIPWPGFKHSNI